MSDNRDDLDAIVFFVRDEKRQSQGYSWRLWWGVPSFYIKTRYPAFKNVKVSLHGPDPRYTSPWLKFGLDKQGGRISEGSGAVVGRANLPMTFTGKRVKAGVRHVIRIRHPWTMFHETVPSAPMPDYPKGKGLTVGVCIPPPKQMYSVDVDIYLCEREPYWPNEGKARRARAPLGPIRNKAGQYLTAVIHQNSMLRQPPPGMATAPTVEDPDDIVQGLTYGVHDEVLWISETRFSRAALAAADSVDTSSLVPSWLSVNPSVVWCIASAGASKRRRYLRSRWTGRLSDRLSAEALRRAKCPARWRRRPYVGC